MGAILSDFPSLPADGDPDRVDRYTRVYSQLAHLGLAVPATPANVITRAALLAHLQALAGQIIKDEITNNPESLNYAGSDAATATEISSPYTPPAGRRWPGANATGYRTLAGSTTLALIAELNPGGGDPGFTGPVFDGLVNANAVIRFRAATTTVALRGQARLIQVVATSAQLNLAGPLPLVVPAGEIFDVGVVHPSIIFPGRHSQILRGLPYSPNALTAADIAAAKV